MLTTDFNDRILANMEVALQRACSRLSPEFDDHESRKLIAQKIIECARNGQTSLGQLTAAGVNALHRFDASADTSRGFVRGPSDDVQFS